jgi:hypothetical protein
MEAGDWSFLRGVALGIVLGFMGNLVALGFAGGLYRNGQQDALNGIWKYQKVTTSDGVVHYLEVTTQPSK